MSDIYINEATGKKIKVYQVTDVHVWDEDDSSFDFRDTAEGVADWCMENVDSVDLEDDEKCEYCGGDCPHLEGEDEDTKHEYQCEKYDEDKEGHYEDLKKYHQIQDAYADEDWEQVIALEGCRYCEYEYEKRWVVEEIENEQ